MTFIKRLQLKCYDLLLMFTAFWAAGMFTKQADQLTAKFLNDVNDSVLGGAVVSLPTGITGPPVSATQPGDRIILDDATALALSDTAVGTLFGGIYEYVHTLSTATAAPAVGTLCFFRAADIGGADPYLVTSDAQPSAAIPAFVVGVFISAITKGNFGWVQISGIATVLYDAATPTDATAGRPVFAKISPTTASTVDAGLSVTIATTVTQVPYILGVAVETPTNAGLKKVAITRWIARL